MVTRGKGAEEIGKGKEIKYVVIKGDFTVSGGHMIQMVYYRNVHFKPV